MSRLFSERITEVVPTPRGTITEARPTSQRSIEEQARKALNDHGLPDHAYSPEFAKCWNDYDAAGRKRLIERMRETIRSVRGASFPSARTTKQVAESFIESLTGVRIYESNRDKQLAALLTELEREVLSIIQKLQGDPAEAAAKIEALLTADQQWMAATHIDKGLPQAGTAIESRRSIRSSFVEALKRR